MSYKIDIEIDYETEKHHHLYKGCSYTFNNGKLIIIIGEYHVTYDFKLISYLLINRRRTN